MSDLDILGVLDPALPQGPDAAADPKFTTIGPVYAVNAAARLVRVGVHGSDLWLPAQPGRYRIREGLTGTGLARVLLNPTTGRPALVLGPVDPRDPDISATLTAINTTTKVATVTVDGASYGLPYIASTYTVGTPVWVGLTDWGVPHIVRGPSDVTAAPAPVPVTPIPGATTVQVQQVIGPQWSGSWRASRSRWNDWNSGRYGYPTTLYQGNGFGSGPMTGLATYGDQFVNLGATVIDRVDILLPSVGLSGASGPPTIQGATNASQPAGAPSTTGGTFTGGFDPARGVDVAGLDATAREQLRTGVIKGIALVGANYWAVAGAGNGDGMVAVVTYTRPA